MVLLDTNCRNTVLSNTVFVPSFNIQHRSDTKMVQSITCTVPDSTVCVSVLGWIQYEYSTNLYRYSTHFLLFACIHSLIPTPIHFKMALMYYHGWPSTQPGSLHTALQRKCTQPCCVNNGCKAVSAMRHGCVQVPDCVEGHPWLYVS